MLRTRRRVIRAGLGLATCAAASATLIAMPARRARAQAARQSAARPDRVILLGTQGGPNFLSDRAETANAVVVDGVVYLVDCGYGALGALIESGLGYLDIAHVFLTHLHDDHSSDLAALLSHQWTRGRIEPTTVHGPFGTTGLVDAAIAFGAANAAIRLVDEARSVKPRDIFRASEIGSASSPVDVFEDERVAVSAVENRHYPKSARERMRHRSLAYRFDTPSRSIVFSGDTAYSPEVVSLAKDADVLICEAMDAGAMRRAFDAKVAAGAYADNPEGIWEHIAGTHVSTEEAGRMAAEAGVGLLVLNHVLPGALGDLTDDVYIAGVRRAFDGEVVVGRDFMEL